MKLEKSLNLEIEFKCSNQPLSIPYTLLSYYFSCAVHILYRPAVLSTVSPGLMETV
jgi:hypothetical protein